LAVRINWGSFLLSTRVQLLALFSQNKELSFFVNNSINNSPQLYEYSNLILSNSIDSQLIVAANRYQVTGSGNAYYAPVFNGFGYDVAITNGQQLSALVTLNKQIYNKRNLSLQFENLRLQRDSMLLQKLLHRILKEPLSPNTSQPGATSYRLSLIMK
jgi:hypothetical protein